MWAERLRKLRTLTGLTQKGLANETGISTSTISRHENGDIPPDAEALMAYSDFYGVTTDYLLGRTDDPNIHIINAPPKDGDAGFEVEANRPLTDDEIEEVRLLLRERRESRKRD